MPASKKIKSTVYIDERLHKLAKKHGINLSFEVRKAILQKSEVLGELERENLQKERKERKQYATLEPLRDPDGVIEDDCNDVIQ